MDLELDDRTAIVTGAGRGIGQRIATAFAEQGANVVAAARTESELERTVERVEELGAQGIAVPTDLEQLSDIDNLIDRTLEEFGTPEILINNAGANLGNAPLEQSIEEIDTMLSVNVRGLFLLSQRFGNELRKSDVDDGRIVNISSISGQICTPRMTFYGATKLGLQSMSRGLAAELAKDGVTVNCVSPGLTAVDRITEKVEADVDREKYAVDRIPLERLAEPEEIADACLFLASDLATYITGENINVDGGVTWTAGMYK